MADLEQQVHHAESAALAVETRVAQMDARQNEARAIDLNRNLPGSTDKPAGSETSDSSSWRTAAPWELT